MVRVDSVAYCILGEDCNYWLPLLLGRGGPLLYPTNVTNRVITPTQTTLTVGAGPMQVNVTFFNPVEVLFELYKSLNVHLHVLSSLEIGSDNQYHSHTFLSRQCHWTMQLIKWKCIRALTEVREVVFESTALTPENLRRLDFRSESQLCRVECDIEFRCHLPFPHIVGTSHV